MSYELIAIGEAMLELNLKSQAPQGIGGDTLNTVAMASIAGLKTGYVTKIAQDLFTNYYSRSLEEYNISSEFIVSSKNTQNGIYFIHTDEQGERSFQYYRKGSAASQLALTDFHHENYLNTKALYASGISMAISESMRNFVITSFEKAKRKRIYTAFVINYRSSLWSFQEARMRLQSIFHLLDTLFLSEDELNLVAETLKVKAEPEEVAKACFQKSIQEVILTQGSSGVTCFMKNHDPIHIASPQVNVIDTTGAGDVFNGAYLAKKLQGEDLEAALHFAVTAAALQCTKEGSLTALPTVEEIESLRSKS